MLERELSDGILRLRMARPPVNALDPSLVAALREAIEHAPDAGARGVILTGAPGMFSAGLDAPVLLGLDRAQMAVFFRDFFALCAALAGSPIPIAGAISGHSPAGGAVLALFCDYRVMARGEFRIGLNEVQVGLHVPEPIQRALRRLVGAHRAERLLVSGAMLDPEQALAVGFVDALAAPDAVEAQAREWLRGLLALPPHAMRRTRAMARADLAAMPAEQQEVAINDLLEVWFSAETQATFHALVVQLKAKSAANKP